jgi:hypothetical protein
VREQGPTIPRQLLTEVTTASAKEELFLLFADCQGRVRGVILIGSHGRNDLNGHSFVTRKVVMTAIASEHLNSGIKCVGFLKRDCRKNMQRCACYQDPNISRTVSKYGVCAEEVSLLIKLKRTFPGRQLKGYHTLDHELRGDPSSDGNEEEEKRANRKIAEKIRCWDVVPGSKTPNRVSQFTRTFGIVSMNF